MLQVSSTMAVRFQRPEVPVRIASTGEFGLLDSLAVRAR